MGPYEMVEKRVNHSVQELELEMELGPELELELEPEF